MDHQDDVARESTYHELPQQNLQKLVITSQALQDLLVAGEVDKHCQGIFRDRLKISSSYQFVCSTDARKGRTHGVV